MRRNFLIFIHAVKRSTLQNYCNILFEVERIFIVTKTKRPVFVKLKGKKTPIKFLVVLSNTFFVSVSEVKYT